MDPNTGLWLCRGVVLIGAIMIAAGTFISPLFSSKIDAKKDGKIDKLVKGNSALMIKNEELVSKVEKYQGDLRIKDEKIKQLEIQSKKISRGVSSSFDFNGAKRTTTRPGHISVDAGQEVSVFQNMAKLEQKRDFSGLIFVCEEQIKKTPDWLTPYLFLGIAYANIGQKENAIKNLEYVLENAPEDPAYAQAAEILKKLKEQ